MARDVAGAIGRTAAAAGRGGAQLVRRAASGLGEAYSAGERAVITRQAEEARAALVRKFVIEPGPGPVRLRVRPADLTAEEQRLLSRLAGATMQARAAGAIGLAAAIGVGLLTIGALYLLLRPAPAAEPALAEARRLRGRFVERRGYLRGTI